MKEKLRIKLVDIIEYPVFDLMCMVVGKNIINNPKIVRMDDVQTGDVVFYEKEKK